MHERLSDTAEALRRIQSHWLSHAIHDLRGLLLVARGYTRLALEDKTPDLSLHQRNYLKQALTTLADLAAKIEDLKELASVTQLRVAELDLGHLSRHAVASIQGLFPKASISLTSEENLPFMGNETELLRALHDFLKSAVIFTDGSGAVHLEATRSPQETTVVITASTDKEEVPGTVEIGSASRIWRLHGGSVSVVRISAHIRQWHCALPVLR